MTNVTGIKSGLYSYALGIVVENKPEDTDLIRVSLPSVMPLSTGSQTNDQEEHQGDTSDADGVPQSESITSEKTIVAKWIRRGESNRITAPDVSVGETVEIFRFGETDHYFWSTIYREPELRGLEHVLTMWSNLPRPEKFKVPMSKDNSYFLEVSTRDKHIHLHTSTSDGEPVGFDFIIDTKEGVFSIKDTEGNSLEWRALEGKLVTNMRSTIECNTENVVNNARDGIINNAPETTHSGEVVTEGSTSTNGLVSTGKGGGASASFSGPVEMDSGLSVKGNVNVTGNVTAGGVVSGSNI